MRARDLGVAVAAAGVLAGHLLVGTPGAAGAAERLTIKVAPASRPIVLDGVATDWEGAPVAYLERSVRLLSALHDDANLYLMFRFGDDMLARRISRVGVTLWFAPAGSSERTYAIRYAGSTALTGAWAKEQPEPPEGRRPKGRPVITPGMVTVIGPDGVQPQPESSSTGLAAASALADGSYCYELRIPLASLPALAPAPDGKKPAEVALGIEIGGLTDAERKEIASERGTAGDHGGFSGRGYGGSGARGDRGGGMGGARGGGIEGTAGGRQDGPSRFERPAPVWLTLQLEPAASTESGRG